MGSNSFISLVSRVQLFNWIITTFLVQSIFNLNRALYTNYFQNFIPSFENSVDLDQLASKEAS